MSPILIRDDVWKSVAGFRLPDSLGFGIVPAPVMYSAAFEDGRWSRGELVPYGPIDILPGARALHFAEQRNFNPQACRPLGIHAPAAREASALADQFLRIAREERKIGVPLARIQQRACRA